MVINGCKWICWAGQTFWLERSVGSFRLKRTLRHPLPSGNPFSGLQDVSVLSGFPCFQITS